MKKLKKNHEYQVKLSLSDEEVQLLNRLADTLSHDDVKYTTEKALEFAMMVGCDWDTFIYEKIANVLWQMGGCSLEDSDKLIDSFKQKLNDEREAMRAERNKTQEMSEEVDEELEPGQ